MSHSATFVESLAEWAARTRFSEADTALSTIALKDTVACAMAAREHGLVTRLARYDTPLRWTVASHVLDFDDLHLPTTTHISTVCVPAALASGGSSTAYLTGAGVMARVGAALGWTHYARGWHATCSAGAPAAAAAAAAAYGLDQAQITTALTLAVLAVSGVQGSFGSDAKSLQVGFAVDAGVRAARLAADGAVADATAFDEWLGLVGGSLQSPSSVAAAIPGGLAVKLFPCCYALQRPIHTLRQVTVDPDDVVSVDVRTSSASLQPLIQHLPTTGLEAKFSMEYAVATALVDRSPSLEHFTDGAIVRPQVRRIMERVRVHPEQNAASSLLEGEFLVDVQMADGAQHSASMTDEMPGAAGHPIADDELAHKIDICLSGTGLSGKDLEWTTAGDLLGEWIP
jgi:2-methylcitrate dehydratase PrpD